MLAPAAVIGGGVEALKQLYQRATGSSDAPDTSTEAMRRMLEKGAEFGIGTKVGQKVGEGIGALGRKIFQRPMTADTKAAQEFAREGMPYGGQQMAPANPLPMTPAQLTEDSIYQIVDNVSKSSIFGTGSMAKFQQNNEALTRATLERFADSIGKNLDKEQLGQMFVMMNRGDLRLAQAPARAIYTAIEQQVAPKMVERTVLKPHPTLVGSGGKPLTVPTKVMEEDGGAWVDMRPLKTWAKDIAKRGSEIGGAGRELTGLDLAKKIVSSNDFVSYQAAKDFRMEARAIAEEFAITNKKAPAIGLAKRAEGALTKQIDEGLGQFNPQLQQQWRTANKIYAQASAKYDNTFVRHLIKVATQKEGGLPEQIYGMIVKPQGVSVLRRAKAAISAGSKQEGKELWQSFGEKALLSSMEKATDKTTKRLDMQTLHNLLFGKLEGGEQAGLGIKTLRELYSNEQIDWLRKAINLGIQQQKGNPTDIGGMLVQMKTGGAIATFLGGSAGYAAGGAGGGFAGAGAILLGPEMLARLMTNPEAAKLFVRGLNTKIGSPQSKEIQKGLSRWLGLTPAGVAFGIPGRIAAQHVGEDIRQEQSSAPFRGLSLPPIAQQLRIPGG